MGKIRISLLLAALTLLPLASESASDATRVLRGKYACEDGTTLFASFRQNPARVSLKHGDRSWRLPIARSGSGARYSNGRITFWEAQGEATLEGKGVSLKCKVERPSN